MNKRLKFTKGFCNLLIGYAGGSHSYSYQLQCMLSESWLNTPIPKYPIELYVPELLWKDLILTMGEVIGNDNKRDAKIAKAMLKQLN